MNQAREPLQVALIGPGARELARSVAGALSELLSGSPALSWLVCQTACEARSASLRWLLACEEDPQETPEQSIAALQAHQAQRQTLHALGLSYQVLRGSRADRTMQALHSLSSCLPELVPHLPQTGVVSRRPGAWTCDACSDPDCEHRSFTALLAQRDSG